LKIVICDYKADLGRPYEYEVDLLKAALPETEIVVYEYKDENKAEFIELMKDADAAINTYVTFDYEILSQCKKLKCIALNAMGYNMVDVAAATEFGVMVCPVAEYCTEEVAEHTLALMLALCRGLRKYMKDIENHIWDYMGAGEIERISGKTITIFGFGKIGKAVALRCQALGLKVQVVSGSLKPEAAEALGLKLVDWQTALETSDILANHMAMNAKNANFFDLAKFEKAAPKKPLFINTGRGGTVVQDDLVKALDLGYLRGAGLDVLDSENPDFNTLNLLGRDNVIITPHTGFYSVQSARALQDIACNTVISAMTGRYDQIGKIVNKKELNL